MPKCAAITRSGQPCKGFVHPGHTYCPAHDPKRADARKKAASKAGRSKPGSELSEVKGTLRQLADDVLEGKRDRADASVAAQILGVFLRAVEAERKIREQEDFEARLNALEELQEKERRGGYG